jgi:hypothetical protein
MPRRNRLSRSGSRKKTSRMRKVATAQIGDGKTPNKYWVSITDDYYVHDPRERLYEMASEVKGIKTKGKTVKVFKTYEEAKAYADSIELRSDVIDGIEVNTVNIEDRLTGQVYERSLDMTPQEDISFTIKEEKKRGVKSSIRKGDDETVTAGNLVDYITRYEEGTISREDYLRLFSYLIRTGQAWGFQGSIYGRPVHDLIESGVIDKKGKINWKKVEEEL